MKNKNYKYNLSSMNVGDHKLFPLELHDRLRLAAHFTGKRYGWKFKTQKMAKKIKVTRVI